MGAILQNQQLPENFKTKEKVLKLYAVQTT
jgi:hypothetical protein